MIEIAKLYHIFILLNKIDLSVTLNYLDESYLFLILKPFTNHKYHKFKKIILQEFQILFLL